MHICHIHMRGSEEHQPTKEVTLHANMQSLLCYRIYFSWILNWIDRDLMNKDSRRDGLSRGKMKSLPITSSGHLLGALVHNLKVIV